MSLTVRVQGGTNAGCKRPPKTPEPWVCPKAHYNPRYAVTCLHPGCTERR